MKLSLNIMAVMASLTMICTAQSSLTPRGSSAALLEAAEASYPTCSLKCMAKAIPTSGCDATDVVCLCTNAELQESITLCAMQSCTVFELLTTKNVTETMCSAPVRDRRKDGEYIGVIGGCVALLALATPPTVFSVILANNGLGKDMWTLTADEITTVLFYYVLGECFYLAAMAMTKVTFCLLFLRVFREKPFIYYVWGTLGLSVAYGVSFVAATIFQCWPVSYGWHQWDGLHTGTCNNIHLQGWLSSIINIVLDIIVIGLPLNKLSQLVMSPTKKITIMFMFSLGIFVTAVSIIRLQSLIQFANTTNITWDYSPAAYWSTLEMHVGIFCGCLPALRPLLNMIMPKLQTTAAVSTQRTAGTTGKRSFMSSKASAPKRTEKGDFIPLDDVDASSTKFLTSSHCNAV
ncbi:uncharacterized protein EAF02_003048 [Botrytis sinoallii]|uniref:uncharacterized protein n=1 Tax=Botrytis sinoallii TaxID=1463999 RepID=UPI0018FF9274|nr:uncharacterized protein EAF02_003048 [Botrytis sinoallii]KAF7888507.1 hypothetical protein EAF02_003048 [Botrytis sinoallii]